MNRWLQLAALVVVFSFVASATAPAALVWRRGEGWTWERGGVPLAANPKEQLELGRRFEQEKDWDTARACYQRLIKKWPTSAFAAEAQFRIAICYEQQGYYAQAVDAYQKVVENYPNTPQFREIIERQFQIGNLFLSGAKHKVWKFAVLPGWSKALDAYQKVIHNAPSSDLAPKAQLNIGLVNERKKQWADAIQAYQSVIDRYHDSDSVDDAFFQLGSAYFKQSRSADYDQDAARRAIDAFTEFISTFPEDERILTAKNKVAELERREAEGLYKIAKFYDRKRERRAALIYYSELVRLHRDSEYAKRVIPRLEELKAHYMTAESGGATR